MSICATRSAESDQHASPSTERVPTPEHLDASPAAPEVDQPMATTADAEATQVVSPGAETSAAASELWMNHVSDFCMTHVA